MNNLSINRFIYKIYMYHKIVNPETGRKVNCNSKLGKKIIQKYLKMIGGFPQSPDGTQDHKRKCRYCHLEFRPLTD